MGETIHQGEPRSQGSQDPAQIPGLPVSWPPGHPGGSGCLLLQEGGTGLPQALQSRHCFGEQTGDLTEPRECSREPLTSGIILYDFNKDQNMPWNLGVWQASKVSF